MNEILVLYILKRHDLTIYSLQKAIEEIFFPYYKPSVGSLSPILDKMQEKGLLSCDEKFSKGGLLSKKFSIDITASGGVSSIEDIIALKNLNLYGAIIGKAYYVGAIKLQEALEAVK